MKIKVRRLWAEMASSMEDFIVSSILFIHETIFSLQFEKKVWGHYKNE